MPRILRVVISLLLFTCSCTVAAAATPPSADHALKLKASRDATGLTLIWTVGPGVGTILILGPFGDQAAPASRMLDRLGLLHFRSADGPMVVRSMDGLTRELAATRSKGKPVVVDFVACVKCRLMDAVLRRPDVQKHLAALMAVRADVTAVDANSRA